MRVRSLIAAITLSGFVSVAQLQAQQPAANQAPANAQSQAAPARLVAVIDVGHILQNHPTLKTKMESIKGQMEAAEKDLQAKREAIIKQLEKLKEQYNEGTAEYDRAEKTIADQDTQLRLETLKKRKEIESAQANVLYEVHGQITSLLEHLSSNAGFQVILQVSRQPVDPKKPETLDMAMSQNVLYFNKSVDVTDWVLKALEHQLGGGNGSTVTPAARSASPGGPVQR